MNPNYLKVRDLGLMRIQGNITKAAFALIKATEFVLTCSNEGKDAEFHVLMRARERVLMHCVFWVRRIRHCLLKEESC